MAQVSVDKNGDRIKTDILVVGCISNLNKQFKLLIPVEISSICFDYWLVKFCDEWDEKYSDENVENDGQIATVKNFGTISVYGCHSINRGCDTHSWEIKLNRY